MVYADPFHNYCVALVVPLRPALEKWAKEAGIDYGDFSQLCENGEAIIEVQRSLSKVCKSYSNLSIGRKTIKIGSMHDNV